MPQLKRQAHVLRHNKGTRTPRTMFFFDTEARTRKRGRETHHELRLGWVCHWERRSDRNTDRLAWQDFREHQELWSWVLERLRPRERAVIVAHNIVYDLLVTGGLKYLFDAGFTEDYPIYDQNRTFIYKLSRSMPDGRTQRLVLIDNFNMFPFPLEELGRVVGLPKGNLSRQQINRASDEKLSAYCRRDVEILLEWWRTWTREITEGDLGNWSMTLAGQAFAAFRHHFMKTPILIHDSQKVIDLERNAFHGGRTECFRIGKIKGRVWELDMNGTYPAAMRKHDYPTRLLGTRSVITPEELLAELDAGKLAVAKVLISTESPDYPVRATGGLIFPVGTFWTYLTTSELRHALERGRVDRIKMVALYQGAPIFREYIDEFYGRRLEAREKGDTIREAIYKLLCNSLFGKFGQKSPIWRDLEAAVPGIRSETIYSAVTGARYQTRQNGDRLQVCEGYAEGRDSFPAIPAHVTGYVRTRMLELVELAGRENVYYTDTDSLFVNARGLKNLADVIDADALGALSVREVGSDLEIRTVKDYTFMGEDHRKGIRSDATEIEPGVFRQTIWPGLGTHARMGKEIGYVNVDIVKHSNPTYTKGTVGRGGKVSPLRLEV